MSGFWPLLNDDSDEDEADDGEDDDDDEQLGSFFCRQSSRAWALRKATVGGGSRGGAALHRALVTTEGEFKMSAWEWPC